MYAPKIAEIMSYAQSAAVTAATLGPTISSNASIAQCAVCMAAVIYALDMLQSGKSSPCCN
jgi:hypothetical protein